MNFPWKFFPGDEFSSLKSSGTIFPLVTLNGSGDEFSWAVFSGDEFSLGKVFRVVFSWDEFSGTNFP